ncbi:hypothetical protein PHET_03029 [Paragonimus heterotremus]|uniref:Uncharacterized protein n=1 Tax=Paragonimus heterotremus TaxID=100268 RepID=A0A8J4SRR2_9TREM|nr:hypothetical protein PHET_03029 [Paragonimus heterotremus]
MAHKFASSADKKAPQFFIPATYKSLHATPGQPTKVGGSVPGSTSAAFAQPCIANHIHVADRQNSVAGQTNRGVTVNNISSKVGTEASKPGSSSQSGFLLASPSGVLDLSHYNYVPVAGKATVKAAPKPPNGDLTHQLQLDEATLAAGGQGDTQDTRIEKEKKRRRFRRPRRNSKLDRLIRFLEDKRVADEDNGGELEDLQMPRLRKYASCWLSLLLFCILQLPPEALNEACMNRFKDPEPCDNQTFSTEPTTMEVTDIFLTSGDGATDFPGLAQDTLGDQSHQPNYPVKFPPLPSTNFDHWDADRPQSSLTQLHSPPDVSITQSDNMIRRNPEESHLNYPTGFNYEPSFQNPGNYPWSHQRYP